MPEPIAVIRPAKAVDIDHYIAFAQEAGPGITSLPRNAVFLEKLLSHSEGSFSLQPKHESYLFCLELDGEVIGSSGVVSRIGVEEPFFAFHKMMETHAAPSLNIENVLPVLHFIEARKKPTELGTLYLSKAFRGKGLSPLLSYARFLFIALFRERFASTVVVELRGVNHEGISPFWEAVGRHFFGLDFSEADHLRLSNPTAIKELFPRHPIYPVLLPKEAQDVISTPHPRTAPAKKILEKQGFQMSEYLDIMDAGPHLYAPTDDIHAVQNTKRATILELRATVSTEQKAIVSNTEIDFRACATPILIEENRVVLPTEVGRALNVDAGDEILYYSIS